MKTIITLILVLLTIPFNANAQWVDYGSKISTSDNVGIGVASTIAKLHVVTQEDAVAWPVVFNNTRNSSTVSGYGVGIKLKQSWNHETWKWGGIASIQEGQWANNSGLAFYANETEHMRINHNSNVGIGTIKPDSKLTVAGKIHARGVKVTINAGADFVFDKNYDLPSLTEVEKFVIQNKHLPEIASEKEMQKNGLQLGDISIKLLQKIEELTLYTIQQQKEITALKVMVAQLIANKK